MLTREQAQSLVKKVFSMVDAEQSEVILTSAVTNSTRFSNNVITQNVGLSNDSLRLRVVIGRRQGVATVNQFDDDSIRRCVQSALAVAKVSAEDSNLLPMLDQQPQYETVTAWREATAKFSAAQRAEAVGRVLAEYDRQGIEGAGIFDTDEGSVCYANSRGVFGYKAGTKAEFSVSAFVDGGTVEGWAESFDLDVGRVKVEAAGKRAAEKALAARNPRDLEPGEYTVIFEPAAVAEMVLFYGWLAGNGLSFAEKRSFHKGELGQKRLDSRLTITEDPYHPELGGTPFDMEGFARQRVTLVDKGVIAAVCHDRRSAALCGGKNTGHANPQPDSGGPGPDSLVVATGSDTPGAMLAGTKKGLLVTKLHYTNTVNAQDVSITGMTRAGTYWIENGKISHAVKNMRFTQSLLSAFADIEAIGNQAHATGGALFGGNFVVPDLKIRRWRFSSPTGF
ncbi:MAG: TldD/PmbA family protein [Planctomycetes bacterium]|jgi:predicted Zn-dependent protease|nr:TldD/PmbA family protein [Planctomycetota bacterium]MCL4730324.1 TldD/PmbA family protein [Planctomycetota bacterium]